MIYIDRKCYEVFGQRGDWGLRVKDEMGVFEYITHYTRQSDAIADGRFYASLYTKGLNSAHDRLTTKIKLFNERDFLLWLT